MRLQNLREEHNPGLAVQKIFEKNRHGAVPAVIANRGPFFWGPDPAAASHKLGARMAHLTRDINPAADPLGSRLHHMHKDRATAYYGQAKGKQ